MEAVFLDLNFEKLYELTFPLSEDKTPLYFQGQYRNIESDKVLFKKGQSIDLGTYFNSFSLKKWIEYTTISKLNIKLRMEGKFHVEFYGMSFNKNMKLPEYIRVRPNLERIINTFMLKLREEVFSKNDVDGPIEQVIDIKELNDKYEFDLIGIKLTALSNDSVFYGGEYFGSFETKRDVKIGITICTFKREKYLLSNLNKLKVLTNKNPNINVMVIDNGQTLEEHNDEKLQIIHNLNFGGSGGFTRGMIEQVNQKRNTHVILMDDDIVIEISSFDRLYKLLQHLRTSYLDNFFAGAMIRLEKPTIQFENTAYWNKRAALPYGSKYDLKKKKFLCKNEYTVQHKNQYAGWWFCCIPIEVIKKIGYPLPVFIKGDDIEYSIRNGKPIMSMNGVGVWHENFFKKKWTVLTQYFDHRNMLLVHHFFDGYDKSIFKMIVLRRIAGRIKRFEFSGLRALDLALQDLNQGLYKLTSIGSDKKFEMIKDYSFDKNIISTVISILKSLQEHYVRYDELDKEYKKFRDEKLLDQKFWQTFLGLDK